MDKKVLLRINSVLKHIDRILKDTDGVSLKELEESDLLLRATCFSIAQIGEMMNQLEKSLSSKYDKIPWREARNMRNIIVHDYDSADVEQVYSTIRNDLPLLKTAFLTIKEDIKN